jgi:hypothetical protein
MKEAVELRDLVCHRHGSAFARLILRVSRYMTDEAVQRADLLGGQLVLGEHDIGLTDQSIPPNTEPPGWASGRW